MRISSGNKKGVRAVIQGTSREFIKGRAKDNQAFFQRAMIVEMRKEVMVLKLGDFNDIPEDLARTADFHGHLCPGLVLGYRAVKAAMERGGWERPEDEELICVAENDSCSVDAVQFLAGCTFGKGNLYFRDHGKQVFTFVSRRDPKKGIRISLRPDAWPSSEGDTDPEERRRAAMERFLALPLEELFRVDEVEVDLPPEAEIRPSILCDRCGEPTMETKAVREGDNVVCVPCSRGWVPPWIR